MPTSDFRGLGEGAGRAKKGVIWPEGKLCETCMNFGWIQENGALWRCPECAGESNVARNSPAAVRALLAREHAETERIRAVGGLPPLGQDVARVRPEPPGAPPPGWAKTGVPVPTTVSEEQRERTRARIAAATQQIAAKWRKGVAS